MTAIGVGLSVAGQAAGFAGQQKQTDDYNAAAAQNAVNASLAATTKYQDEGMKRTYEARKLNQEGYDAIMKARDAAGTATASAGTSGMDMRSVTINNVLADIENAEANSVYNTQHKHDDANYVYRQKVNAASMEAKGRTSSMPFKEGPSPLGAVLGIATDVVGGVSKSPKGKAWFGA